MQKLILVLLISVLSLLDRTKCDDENQEIVSEFPPVKATLLVDLEDEEVAGNKTSEEIRGKCEQTNYRSYVRCLLEETKRKKRQCGASGSGCPTVNQGQCVDAGCLRDDISQLPCSGTGCVYSGHNCGGNGCVQIGQTCYGIGCVPPVTNVRTPCRGSSGCDIPPQNLETTVKIDTTELSREIGDIREQLRLVKEQNERLIVITEKATTLILQTAKRPLPEPRIIREPFLVKHNLTTNIDINNYLNNTNVVNLPSKPAEPTEDPKPHCCTVVRPKTCRRALRPPYFVCGHKRHRTCGSHCSGKRVVHSQVKPGCGGDSTENCVSYESNPYYSTYSGYPTSGYYPPMPIYYPQFYPMYVTPPMPIFAAPSPSYSNRDETVYLDEDCEDCESEEETENCEDQNEGCKRVAKKGGVRHTGLIRSRSIPLAELDQVKEEALAIKRSEDQLTVSLDMLKEAVELETIEERQKKDAQSSAKEMIEAIDESGESE